MRGIQRAEMKALKLTVCVLACIAAGVTCRRMTGKVPSYQVEVHDKNNPVYKCDADYPRELDVGIYWAALTETGAVEWKKQCVGDAVPNYVQTRDTLIFIHGAQPGMVDSDPRMFLRDDENEFARAWLATNWNVGYFHARQFMDEPLEHFKAAEGKIWNAHYFGDMRYKYVDKHGARHTADAPVTEDLTHIFLRFYGALTNGRGAGGEMRLAGHSLGSQMAMRAAFMISADHFFERKVDRVALLDPVHSNDAHSYFSRGKYGQTTGAVLGYFADVLHKEGVAIELYKSTVINRCLFASQTNTLFTNNVAMSNVVINGWGDNPKHDVCYSAHLLSDPVKLGKEVPKFARQITHQHIGIVPYYLISLVHPPKVCDLFHAEGENGEKLSRCQPVRSLALGAAMPTSEVLAWQAPGAADAPKMCFHAYDDYDRTETGPTMTLDPGDDLFYMHDCKTFNT